MVRGLGEWDLVRTGGVALEVNRHAKTGRDPEVFRSITIPPMWDLDQLPPIDGTTGAEQPPFLATLLWSLLTAAGRNAMAPLVETLDPPAIANEFDALLAAAGTIRLNGTILLADRLWRHADALRRGDVARGLGAAGSGDMPGFVLAYADEVRSGVVLGKGMSPIRVEGEIPVAGQATGPYLVLIACRLEGNGRARAVSAFAQPILAGQCFVPVWSELERDVLRAIGYLQVRLDAFGVDCTVERKMPLGDSISGIAGDIVISARGQACEALALTIRIADSAGAGRIPDYGVADRVFVLDRARWDSGSLIPWLARALTPNVHERPGS